MKEIASGFPTIVQAMKNAGILSKDAADLMNDIHAGKVGDEVLKNCGSSNGAFNLFNLFVSPAYAAEGCEVYIDGRKYVLSKVDVENCEALLEILDTKKTSKEVRAALSEIAARLSAIPGLQGASNQILVLARIYTQSKKVTGLLPRDVIGTEGDHKVQQELLDIVGEMGTLHYHSALNQALEIINSGTKITLVKQATDKLTRTYQDKLALAERYKDDDTVIGYDRNGYPVTRAMSAMRAAELAYADLMVFTTLVPDSYELLAWEILTLGVGKMLKLSKYVAGKAPNGGVGFTQDTVGTAFEGMREGHAIRHLQGDIIPNTGSLQSRVAAFKDVAIPILTNPTKTAPWRVGATNGRAFLGSSNGKNVVVVVATDGPKQGKVITSFVPDANQLSIINSR